MNGDGMMARLVQRFDDKVIKPLMRALLRAGLAPSAFALLETTGRKTGRRRLTPVGNGLIGDTFWLIAARGRSADYVCNLVDDPAVRVKIGRRWYCGTAALLPGDDPAHRLEEILSHFGWLRRFDARALQSSIALAGATPVTVKIDIERG